MSIQLRACVTHRISNWPSIRLLSELASRGRFAAAAGGGFFPPEKIKWK